MKLRKLDLVNRDGYTKWVVIPFDVYAAYVDISLQETLIVLQSDKLMQAKFEFGKYNVSGEYNIAKKYPLFWDKTQIYFITFSSSYLTRSGFSRVFYLLSKAHNILGIVKSSDLRL